jgi:hypothetical protein
VKTALPLSVSCDAWAVDWGPSVSADTQRKTLRWTPAALTSKVGCGSIFRLRKHPVTEVIMRPRDRILANLESLYRESYERARAAGETARMVDLESAYMRDQLMLEILLDVRDLLSTTPAAPEGNPLERLDQLRRLVRR